MNILFITRGFPSENDPMAGNYEATQAKAVVAKGHQVSVLAIQWRSILYAFGHKRLIHRVSDGVEVFEQLGIVPIIPHLFNNYKLNRWVMRRKFRKLCQQYLKSHPRPDIVHVHSLYVAKYGIILKDEFGIPTVVTEHWSGLNSGEIKDDLLLESGVYQHADKVIVVSEALKTAVKNYFGIDSVVINNMVDNRFFETQRRQTRNKVFTFVTVGRLVSIKRFDMLVEAFSQMRQKTDVKLIVVGEGAERHKIEKQIEKYSLQGKVIMVGMKKPEEVSEILCDSDCFVLSSHRETFGIVLIEAMAKGLPVISTKCGGPEVFVNKENGLLVAPDNPLEMADAMDYMVQHAEKFNSQLIRNYCYERFSQEKIAEQIVGIYQQVLNTEHTNSIQYH